MKYESRLEDSAEPITRDRWEKPKASGRLPSSNMTTTADVAVGLAGGGLE
jgi:hypothetical protein